MIGCEKTKGATRVNSPAQSGEFWRPGPPKPVSLWMLKRDQCIHNKGDHESKENDNYNKEKVFMDDNVHTACMCGYVNRLC